MENVKENVQQIAPDISLHWINDNRIGYFTIRTTARTSWDGWAKAMTDIKRGWSTDRPVLTLQDNLYDGAALTPTVRHYSTQVSNYRPELKQYVAIVLPQTIVAKFVQFFVRASPIPNGEARVFFTIEEGLDWLQSKP